MSNEGQFFAYSQFLGMKQLHSVIISAIKSVLHFKWLNVSKEQYLQYWELILFCSGKVCFWGAKDFTATMWYGHCENVNEVRLNTKCLVFIFSIYIWLYHISVCHNSFVLPYQQFQFPLLSRPILANVGIPSWNTTL